MKTSEKIRIAYTYIKQYADLVHIKENLIMMDAEEIWGDIRSGSFSTEHTAAMRKHIKEMQAHLPVMLECLTVIDAEIRKMCAEEQIRMDTRGR